MPVQRMVQHVNIPSITTHSHQVIKGTTTKYDVTFIDFGNREQVPASMIKPIDAQVTAVQAMATPCQLAFLKVPGLDSDDGVDAANALCDMLGGGRPLICIVEAQEAEIGRKHAALAKYR